MAATPFVLEIASCPTRTVFLYDDRAEVTRALTVVLEPGEQEVILRGVQSSVVQDSARVTGGIGKATLLEVVDEIHEVCHPADELLLKQLHVQEAVLTDEVERLTRQQTRADSTLEVMSSAARELTRCAATTESFGQQQIAAFAEFATAHGKKHLEQTRNIQALAQSLKVARVKLSDTRAELEKAKRSASGVPERRIRIVLSSETRGEIPILAQVSMNVSYIVTSCGWTAAYDLRYRSESSIELTYYASVTQTTGEVWDDVQLTFSNAKPVSSKTIPPEIRAPVLTLESGSSFVLRSAISPDPSSLADEKKSDNVVLSSGLSVPFRSTLVSDAKPRRITALSVLLPCTLFYRVTPAVSPHAFLEAQTINATGIALPAGPCTVFFENSYIASSSMTAVAPEEEFSVLLGTDPGVRVVYNQKPAQKSTGGVVKKTTALSYEYRTVVRNSKTCSIALEVQQQLPLSTDKRIDVALKTPALRGESVYQYDQNSTVTLLSSNNLVWTWLSVAPGTEVKADLAYTVSWPSDIDIDGL